MSGTWIQKPSLQHVKGRQHIVTLPGMYEASDGTVYTIPAGFVTDGASVPRPLWWLYPPFGEDYEPAVVLHDYLYERAEQFPGSDHGHMSRGEVDDLMNEASEAAGYRSSGRAVMHAGVRSGGWLAWRRHRNRAKARRLEGV